MKKIISSKSLLSVFSLLLLISVFFTACGSQDTATNTTGSTNLSGNVTIIGSTSVDPLAQELITEFKNVEAGITIDEQAIGSTEGITAIHNLTCDIGTSSRELTTDEKAFGLTETTIAIDGIAVVVNPANTVADLTKDQIAKIFKGEITNWKDVGGADSSIIIVNREAGSGTRGAFEELAGLQQKNADGTKISLISDSALIADSNGSVKTNVSTKKNAIGYLSLGIVDNTIKAIKVGGIEASVANINNKSYSLWRPFLMLTNGTPNAQTQAFINFILSAKGQEIVAQKYIKV